MAWPPKPSAMAVFWVGVCLLSLFVHLHLFPYAEDDAYIHFRIARNFAQYGLPYFNLNEPVYATSAISWTLLVAFLFKMFGPLPQAVAVVNGLLTPAGAILCQKFLAKTTPHPVPLIGALFYLSALALASIGLMETPLALLLLFAGLLLWGKGYPAAFALFGAMLFTRLELSLCFGLILAYSLLKKSFAYRKILFWSLAGLLPFIIFALYFWGTLIPNTIIAKQQIYSLSYLDALSVVINLFLPPFFSWQISPIVKVAYVAIWLIFLAHFILSTEIRVRTLGQERFVAYILLLAGIGVMFAYSWRKVLVFGWYVPLYVVPAGIALQQIICLNNRRPRWFMMIISLPWFLAILGQPAQILAAATHNPALYPNFDSGARVRKYLQIGAILYEQYPNATVMTAEIGGLGYEFEGYLLDGAGLISPAALPFHPLKIPEERSGQLGAIPVGFIALMDPDIIVAYDGFVEAFVRSEIAGRYVRVTEPVFLEGDLQLSTTKEVWGNQELYIFFKPNLIGQEP